MTRKARLAALASAAVLVAGAARAAETPPCSLEGASIGSDIDFNTAAARVAPGAGSLNVSCETESEIDVKTGAGTLRFTRARLKLDPAREAELPASLIRIARVEAGAARPLGFAVLPNFAGEEDGRLAPQAVEKNGALLIRLAPRHRHVFRLSGDTLTRIPAFEWRGELSVEPALAKGGQPLDLDLERMEGRVALIRQSETAPAGQSAAQAPKIAVAKLDLKDDKLVVVNQSVVEPEEDDDLLTDVAETKALRDRLKGLPAGVEPCALSGFSVDTDPNGLNVRAAPSASARILGVVPPPLRFTEKDKSEFGVGPLHAEFSIVGYRDGWFLIEEIAAPGQPYGRKYEKTLPQPFKGRGWVSARMVSAQQGNMGRMFGLLYDAPNAKASFTTARDDASRAYTTESTPAHLSACSGRWGFVETKAGSLGWTASLCSNQVTTCG